MKAVKKGDILTIMTFILLAVLSAVMLSSHEKTHSHDGGLMAEIYIGSNMEARFSLDGNVTYDVPEKGIRIIIENGEVSVTESNCPDKLCVNMKPISREGQSIICLPMRCRVVITGNSGGDIDAMSE